jgi:hypothetical protein
MLRRRFALLLTAGALAGLPGRHPAVHQPAHRVEWHVRNVFTKLEIRSRRELAIALADSASQLAPG